MHENDSAVTVQLKKLLGLLNKINRTYAQQRADAIGDLQNLIWEEPALQSDELYFLQDLAGDLNFYEPDPRDRDTGLGYYDDARLSEITSAAISQVTEILEADTKRSSH